MSSSSTLCNGIILAPSDNASAGLGCVSRNIPSAPVAIAAFAIVAINSGLPPVTPLIGLLYTVCDVHNDGKSKRAHGRNSSEIY